MENQRFQWPLFLRKMTAPEIGEAVKQAHIAILPVGSIEQHGAHLPIDTDLSTAEYLAEHGLRRARGMAARPIAYIAPALPIGVTLEMDWPGHLHLRSSTHIAVLFDVGSQLVKSGFRYVLFINGCVGNIATVNVAVSDLKERWPSAHFISVGTTWAMPEAIRRNSGPGGMGHAGELETSTQMVIDPEHVQMEKAVDEHIQHPSPRISYDFDQAQPFHWPVHFARLTQSGVIGDATAATAENGRQILDANVERIAGILCHLDELGIGD